MVGYKNVIVAVLSCGDSYILLIKIKINGNHISAHSIQNRRIILPPLILSKKTADNNKRKNQQHDSNKSDKGINTIYPLKRLQQQSHQFLFLYLSSSPGQWHSQSVSRSIQVTTFVLKSHWAKTILTLLVIFCDPFNCISRDRVLHLHRFYYN